jgi:hypothetical protein
LQKNLNPKTLLRHYEEKKRRTEIEVKQIEPCCQKAGENNKE